MGRMTIKNKNRSIDARLRKTKTRTSGFHSKTSIRQSEKKIRESSEGSVARLSQGSL